MPEAAGDPVCKKRGLREEGTRGMEGVEEGSRRGKVGFVRFVMMRGCKVAGREKSS